MTGSHGAAEKPQFFAGYEILSTLGQGGMGIVYKARDLGLDRTVALKVLREDLQGRPHLVSRFNREAQAIARLNHPNIVHVYSVGTEQGVPYIVMEYIEGTPLSMVMQAERRLDWNRALDIAGQIADALRCAHDSQIIHRDIKPGNILVDDSGHVSVTDFGIAKILTAETQLTADGSLLGTPQYMAPERCQNQEATATSDIYSLGVLTYQMISGRLPFAAHTPVELVRKIVAEPPPRLRNLTVAVPEDVDRLVAFMMEKKSKDRPATARVLRDVIARVRAGEPLDTRGANVAAALASFRDSMSTPTPTSRTASQYTQQTQRLLFPRVRRLWKRNIQKHTWKYLAGLGALTLVIAMALALARAYYPNAPTPPNPLHTPDQGLGRWLATNAVVNFKDEAPGVLVARINLRHFAVATASACGGSRTVLQLAGIPNTDRDGQVALITADPERRQALLRLAPIPVQSHVTRDAALLMAGAGAVPNGSPLAGCAILSYWAGPPQAERATEYLASWDFRNRAPTYPIFQVETPTSNRNAITAVAVKPDGATLLLGLKTPEGLGYLAERNVRSNDPGGLGPALIETGLPITAAQYAPDGSCAAVVRGAGSRRRQLWIVPTNGRQANARKLAEGAVTLGSNAFSPDGKEITYSLGLHNGRSAIRVVRVSDGQTLADLGEGWMSAWRGKADSLLVTAPDLRGQCQLWTVAIAKDHARSQLTFLDAGLSHHFNVTADNGWAVASLGHAPQSALVMINLTKTTT